MSAFMLRTGLLAFLVFFTALPRPGFAGVVMDCEGTIKAWVLDGYYKSGDCYCSGGKPVCSGGASHGAKGHSGGLSTKNSAKLQVMQGVLDGIVDGMIAKPPPKKQMKPLAPVNNAPAGLPEGGDDAAQPQPFGADKNDILSGLKGLDSGPLDGSAETMAAKARKPFDTADTSIALQLPEPQAAGGPTPFFGDTMPLADIQRLVHPENDPRVVDLRKARTFVADKIKADGKTLVGLLRASEGKDGGGPIVQPPACAALTRKLEGLVNQRRQFQKTIDMAQEELSTWQSANRAALLNAAKEGLEQYVGDLMERLADRGKAAERLQGIYLKNADQMAKAGMSPAEFEARMKRLRQVSNIGQVADSLSNINEWQTFIKDSSSGMLVRLSESNREIQQMLDDPRLQQYFETEAPALKALLDIAKIAAANKVFGKWVARQLPVIGAVEYGINQSYNALDWALSFNRTLKAHEVNGKVLAAAQSLQARIDDTVIALKPCR